MRHSSYHRLQSFSRAQASARQYYHTQRVSETLGHDKKPRKAKLTTGIVKEKKPTAELAMV